MRKKILEIITLIFLFVFFVIFILPKEQHYVITKVISPVEFELSNNKHFVISGYETFDADFTEHNRILAKNFKMTEEDAFILGNLGKYWAENLLKDRKIYILDNDFVYYKFKYLPRLLHSPYCIKNGIPTYPDSFSKLVEKIQQTNYELIDIRTDKHCEIAKDNLPEKYIVVRKGYKKLLQVPNPTPQKTITQGNLKLILTDFTVKLKPDRSCSTEMCKEILNSINQAQSSIDFAIYGYSHIPEIEKAIQNAINRKVKIRMVYDTDIKSENIYPDTQRLIRIIKNTSSDKNSKELSAIMHNKFFIFDNKKVITGSANLSKNDMSGFNSNAMLVINSTKIAEIYLKEFEQMYSGKFHNEKIPLTKIENIYFSPQDKCIKNGVLPLIQNAKTYIYIPAFIISEENVVKELINAHNRNVDVKIIADAVNASAKYSKIKDLKRGNVPVKIENYAGKMHSKSMIIDDKYLIIGSMNFSNSGENKNDENTVIITNPELAIFYKDFFVYQWNKIPNKWLNLYPRAEGIDSIGSCSDGIDNDYDGLIDNDDSGCVLKSK